eukprot:3959659-Pleurochrysis_carterae.AAC.2
MKSLDHSEHSIVQENSDNASSSNVLCGRKATVQARSARRWCSGSVEGPRGHAATLCYDYLRQQLRLSFPFLRYYTYRDRVTWVGMENSSGHSCIDSCVLYYSLHDRATLTILYIALLYMAYPAFASIIRRASFISRALRAPRRSAPFRRRSPPRRPCLCCAAAWHRA